MIKIKFTGYHIGASCHDITEEEFKTLQSIDLNFSNACDAIDGYSRWDTNFFYLSKPVIDDSLKLTVTDESGRTLWSGTCDDILDLYEHASNFPEIEEISDWDEPELQEDAVASEEHPQMLYYEEISKGMVGYCKLEFDDFDPNFLSIVEGCLETEDEEWNYVSKVYYKGKPVAFEPIEMDLKQISEKFILIS